MRNRILVIERNIGAKIIEPESIRDLLIVEVAPGRVNSVKLLPPLSEDVVTELKVIERKNELTSKN